jgi:hypothetical protein
MRSASWISPMRQSVSGTIADLCAQAGQPLPAEWVHQHCHHLKHQGPDDALETLHALSVPERVVQAVQEHVQYLEKRRAVMDSPSSRQLGWPIGSGSVESANKRVMQARLTGAGMQWERAHVTPMLAVRTAICNARWDESWQTVRRQGMCQQMQRRQQRASARLDRLLTRLLLLRLCLRPPAPVSPPSPRLPPAPPATLPGSCRPSAHHPWKRAILSSTRRRAKI